MRRTLVLAVAAAVACMLLAGTMTTGALAQAVSGDAETINDCTVVDEPGEYELGGDISTDESGACLEIAADDVVLDGNGYAVTGPGAGDGEAATGVLVAGSADGAYENVEVRNLEVAAFDDGVQSGTDGDGDVTAATLHDVTVTDAERGVVLRGGDATLTNVTVIDSDGGLDAAGAGAVEASNVAFEYNGYGIEATDTEEIAIDNSTVRYNEGDGVALGPDVFLSSADSKISRNGGHGIVTTGDGVSLRLHDDEVAFNEGDGVLLQDGADAELSWVTLYENEGDGVRAAGGDVTLDRVTAKENAGLDVDARDGSATADELIPLLGLSIDFEAEAVGVEGVNVTDLPDTRSDAEAVSDGFRVTDALVGQADAEFSVDNGTETADVWRHDGDGWTVVEEDVTVDNGTVETTLDAAGTYAAVDADERPDGDADGSNTATETDSDGSSSSGSGSSDGSDGDDGDDGDISINESQLDQDTDTDEGATETNGDDSTSDEATDATDDDEVEESSLADGAGFGAVVALVALVGSALVAARRR